MRFVRKTFQGAYVFSKRLYCVGIGYYYKEVNIFADNKREARQMAKAMFKEIAENDKKAVL